MFFNVSAVLKIHGVTVNKTSKIKINFVLNVKCQHDNWQNRSDLH